MSLLEIILIFLVGTIIITFMIINYWKTVKNGIQIFLHSEIFSEIFYQLNEINI